MTLREVCIGALGEVVTGKTPPTADRSFYEGPHLFVTPTDLDYSSYYVRKTHSTVTDKALHSLRNQIIPANSVMFTCIGNTIGKSGISSEPCLTNQQINSVIVGDEHNPIYVYYLLENQRERIRSIGLGGGAAQPIINKSTFSAIKVAVHDREDQNSIADILSAYDDLIENNRRRIALLEKAARELYREWFVRLRFPGHEHVKVINGVPEGWERKPLGDLLTLQRGFDLPTQHRREGDFPILASTGINGFHETWKVMGPGVVTGRSGSLGVITYVHDNFWPLNTALWIKEYKEVTPEFAYHLLATLHLEQYNGGAAVPTLNRNDAHRIEVVRPPGDLMEEFNETAKASLDQIRLLSKQNKRLAEARDLLLPRLMNGSITV